MEKELFGRLSNGEEVYRITIRSGEYKVSILTLGATICYFGTDEYNAVLSHPTLEEYINDPYYMGESIGPIANRISGASFTFKGRTYHTDKNEGENTLHSGSANYGQQNWSLLGYSDSLVTLALENKEERGGFPGLHSVTLMVRLNYDGTLMLYYRASSTLPCPISLTNHMYFNLSGGEDIRDTVLILPAESYIATDSSLIPTAIESVANTDFDFRAPRRIGDKREGRYDNSYVLKPRSSILAKGRRGKLILSTDMPAVQLYTGEGLSGKFKPFSGFCLEAGGYPNAVNRVSDGFPLFEMGEDKEFATLAIYNLEIE